MLFYRGAVPPFLESTTVKGANSLQRVFLLCPRLHSLMPSCQLQGARTFQPSILFLAPKADPQIKFQTTFPIYKRKSRKPSEEHSRHRGHARRRTFSKTFRDTQTSVPCFFWSLSNSSTCPQLSCFCFKSSRNGKNGSLGCVAWQTELEVSTKNAC